MTLHEVLFEFFVPALGCLEDDLPLVARAELALVPKDARHRAYNLATGSETSFNSSPRQRECGFLGRRCYLDLPHLLRHAIQRTSPPGLSHRLESTATIALTPSLVVELLPLLRNVLDSQF
jgi:hypothetical protein